MSGEGSSLSLAWPREREEGGEVGVGGGREGKKKRFLQRTNECTPLPVHLWPSTFSPEKVTARSERKKGGRKVGGRGGGGGRKSRQREGRKEEERRRGKEERPASSSSFSLHISSPPLFTFSPCVSLRGNLVASSLCHVSSLQLLSSPARLLFFFDGLQRGVDVFRTASVPKKVQIVPFFVSFLCF